MAIIREALTAGRDAAAEAVVSLTRQTAAAPAAYAVKINKQVSGTGHFLAPGPAPEAAPVGSHIYVLAAAIFVEQRTTSFGKPVRPMPATASTR